MHPPEETLLSLATGAADLPLRAMVEGHLSSCAACRQTVGELSLPGSLLFRGLPEEPVPDRLWQQILAQLGPETPATPAATAPPGNATDPLAGIPLPDGTRRELPPIANLVWKSALTPGARYTVLAHSRETGSALFVGHMPARRGFPRHQHLGREDLLVLTGGYEDEHGRYEAGEYTVYEPGSEHRPHTEPDEECWVLMRLERPWNRFFGWRGLLQRFFL